MTNTWSWSCNSKRNFESRDKFKNIFSFFITKCPVDGVSKQSLSFSRSDMTSLCNILKKEIFISDSWEAIETNKLENSLRIKNIFDSITSVGCFAHHTKYEKNEVNTEYPVRAKFKGLFYCIRCAFAHGDYYLKKYNKKIYYIMQNSDNKKGNIRIKGRILIDEDSLVKIMDILQKPQKWKTK